MLWLFPALWLLQIMPQWKIFPHIFPVENIPRSRIYSKKIGVFKFFRALPGTYDFTQTELPGVIPNLMFDLGAWQAQRGCWVGAVSIFTSTTEPMPSLLLCALDIPTLQSAPGISPKWGCRAWTWLFSGLGWPYPGPTAEICDPQSPLSPMLLYLSISIDFTLS